MERVRFELTRRNSRRKTRWMLTQHPSMLPHLAGIARSATELPPRISAPGRNRTYYSEVWSLTRCLSIRTLRGAGVEPADAQSTHASLNHVPGRLPRPPVRPRYSRGPVWSCRELHPVPAVAVWPCPPSTLRQPLSSNPNHAHVDRGGALPHTPDG